MAQSMLRLRLLLLFFLSIALSLPASGFAATGGGIAGEAHDRADIIAAAQEASGFELAEKVGWYRLDDGSRRLLTWSAEGGLTLSDLQSLETMRLQPVAEERFTARNGNGDEFEVRFHRNGTGDVSGFRWLDPRGVERTADRLNNEPYRQQEVQFRNHDVALVGLLIQPAAPGPYPAVVIIPDEQAGSRDNLWYLYQADYLARRGIAVFLPDRRGSGKSGGVKETASFDDLAGDAVAAARRLKSIEGIDPSRIGVIGISDGGWIAPLAATKSQDIRFLVNVSGSAVTPREQIRHEISSDVRRYGTPDFLVPLIAFALEFRSTHRDENWWEANGRFDAVEYWERVSVPVLVVYGSPEERAGIPVRQSIDRLEEARRKSGNENFTIRVLDDTGHTMEDPKTGWIRSEYLDLLSDWIMTQTA